MPLNTGTGTASHTDFVQLETANHWDHQADHPSEFDWRRVISRQFVLGADEFWYFGKEAIDQPDETRPELPKAQSVHGKRTQSEQRIENLISHLRSKYNVGVHGTPYLAY